MAISPMNELVQHLRRSVLLREDAGLTDGQLLGCFVERRDEAALAALVRRHAGMVWGVCRRVLGSHHDAEDAFQATFLVLVRRAGSIASRELLANWLYGVAHQTALKARASAARRKGRERQVAGMPEPEVAQPDLWGDLQPLLDEELSRLPDRYRAVIVLCDLEGKTRKEAARQLGCPEGTVAGRLARARAMLAKRLAQRGVTLPGTALAAALAQNAASACAPAAVVAGTIEAVTLVAAGQAAAASAVSAKAAALTEGVLKTMLLTKFKIGAVPAILGVVLLSGTLWAWGKPDDRGKDAGAALVSANAEPENKPVPKPPADLDRIQGAWTVTGCEIDGKQTAVGPDEKWTVTKGEIDWSGRARPVTLKYALDPKRNPKQIDMEVVGGQAPPGLQYQGIYRLGEETLEVCYRIGGKQRPGVFAGKGESVVLLTLKRLAPDPKTGEADADTKSKDDGGRGQEPEKEDFAAWGKEVGGLQAGLFLRAGDGRTFRLGDTITLVVRVRNVGKEAVQFEYLKQFLDENPPVVTDAAGKPVPQSRLSMMGFHIPVKVRLAPSEQMVLPSRIGGVSGARFELRPAAERGKGSSGKHAPLYVENGKILLQYERVFGNSSAGQIRLDPKLGQLATGKLEIEVQPEKPAALKNEHGGVNNEGAKILNLTDADNGKSAANLLPQAPASKGSDEPAREEPAPRYCWLVFGPKKVRALMRLKGDEVAIDRDGDGKFDGEGERFASEKDCKGVVIADPDGKTSYVVTRVHALHVVPPDKFVSVRVNVRGKATPYPQDSIIKMENRPEGAPRAHFYGPLTVTPYGWRIVNRVDLLFENDLVKVSGMLPPSVRSLTGLVLGPDASDLPKSLKRDRPTPLFAVLATAGENSIVSVCSPADTDEKRREVAPFPKGVHPFVEVEFPAKQPGGQRIKKRYPLGQFVVDGLYRGSVSVPADAGAGKAMVTFSFDPWKGVKAAPTTVEIPVEEPQPEKPAAPKNEKPRPDRERLQGTWKVTSVVENGKEADESEAGDEWTFKDGTVKVKLLARNNRGGATNYLRFRLDETTDPRLIDLVEGKADDLFDREEFDKRFNDAEERHEGVYSLKGDTLTICYSGKKGERPTVLESKEGSEYVLIVLKREPAKDEQKKDK